MEWPETLELEIEGFAQGGAGIGRYEGRPVFVEAALPGEQVMVKLVERRAAWARATVESWLSAPAPERRKAPCPVYDTCGGCDWQHIELQAQRAAKQQILTEQLSYVGRIPEPHVKETFGLEPWSYRSTARFHVAGDLIGFYAAGSRKIVSFAACPLLDPQLNAALDTLRDSLPLPGLKEVTVRVSQFTQQVHVLLHGRSTRDWSAWARGLQKALPAISGVSLDTHKGWRMLAGTPYLQEQLGNITLQISPTSFFQANVAQAQAVLDIVQERIDWHTVTNFLDGFCGVGTFMLPLARNVEQVWGIEEHPAAIKDADATALTHGIHNIKLYTGKMAEILPSLAIKPDLVLLDPPRRGCEEQTLQALIKLAPPQIVYISCHPGTLSRDVRYLVEKGYTQEWSQAFDFFPQTSHLESVTLLKKGSGHMS